MTGFWKWIGRQGRAFAAWRQREKIRKLFVKCWGVEGNFENPSTYGEKSQFRKLYGNREFYGRLADKFLVRDYVRERVGEEVLVPLLGVHDRLDEKILDGLPESFVIKVSNACKWNEIVFDKGKMNRRRTIRYFNRKLRKKYSRKFGEAHYDHSKPRIVIEELLSDEGQLPWNYDFFCYNGSKGFDFAICLTSPDGLHKGQYDRDWNLLEGNLSPEMAAAHVRPANWERMVDIARELSRGIDFVRVDLYGIGDRIFFGEMTFTPGEGFGVIQNPIRKKMRDTMWDLDRGNAMPDRDPADVRAGKI